MKQKFTLLILFLIFITFFSCAKKSQIPKREFRAVWFTTVKNLDWPTTPNESVKDQKADAIQMLDKLHKANFNAIIFQVRDECDAFYVSKYDPWSFYLTGMQGKAPEPFYDPLKFMINESHKRSMELHAWINPFRAEKEINSYPVSKTHISETHPEWVYTNGKTKYLDPGIPDVRNYITDVIVEIIKNYDIDGIHFDDYFYPYKHITNEDSLTFVKYSRDLENIDNWRRDNINLLISQVYDSINVIDPSLKFGISPFGIWKPDHPKGIKGMSAYDNIYCDALAWLETKTVDYITPQLYWKIGGDQDYKKLVKWWSKKLNGRHLYTGQAAYRLSKWSNNEIIDQILINRNNKKCNGSVYFRTKVGILDNPKGLYDSLLTNYYKYHALQPVMEWKNGKKPNPPENLKYQLDPDKNRKYLTWKGDSLESNYNYVIYKFKNENKIKKKTKDPKNIIKIININEIYLSPIKSKGPIYYAVTNVNRNDLESDISELFKIDPPNVTTLLYPENNSHFEHDTIRFVWNHKNNSLCYGIQFSTDSLFENIIFEENSLFDTSVVIAGFYNLNYYWRIKSYGAGGKSNYSNHFKIISKPQKLNILKNYQTNIEK